MVVNIQIEVLWGMTKHNIATRYILEDLTASITQIWRRQSPLKSWYPTTTLP